MRRSSATTAWFYVRWGKANKGSAPKRRSVLTVFPWSCGWCGSGSSSCRELAPRRGQCGVVAPRAVGAIVAGEAQSPDFAGYRDALGLPDELSLHCLPQAYVTHLIEDGYDPLFVQQQVGHSYASTTALYTSVSSDFRTRTLRTVLDDSVHRALRLHEEDGA